MTRPFFVRAIHTGGTTTAPIPCFRSRDCLNCSAVRCRPVVRCANGLLESQHKQTFTILPRSRFRARTGNDEVGKVHSTAVLLSGIVPENTIKRNRTLDSEKHVTIPHGSLIFKTVREIRPTATLKEATRRAIS